MEYWRGMAAYRIICEPTISQLRLSSHNRRHHHLSLSELIKDIISPYDIDIEIDERLSDGINNHIPADWLGAVAFDPITLQPNTNHASHDNDDDNDNNVHHISACYLPFPHHYHIPYGEQLATLGQPHPSLTGLMSASIIDTDSSAITHDRNHRAHIHYHWQNEQGGEQNSDSSSDDAHWVPIASHLVADHMGQTHPLRHGQHVLIDFIDGDIIHPIIIGSTHNGQGNDNAQHNSIVSDSGSIDATSPAWFINQSHAHPIDGIKTQSIDSSRTGDATKDSITNGYNQLMFDAHPDSPQINLYSSSFQSSLTIGHLYQHSDHTRGQARGQGISIETQAAANIQGSTGIHISSQASDPLSKSHMSHDSHGKLQTADQHQIAYQSLAETHQPVGIDGSNQSNSRSNNEGKQQTPFGQFSEDTNDIALDDAGQWQQANLLIDSQRHLALLSGQHSQHTSTQSTHSHATDNTHHHSQTQMN